MDISTTLLIYTSLLGFILGYVVNKTNFCTMGAVSDLVNIGDSSRLKAWLLAITTAILGVTILEYNEVINVSDGNPIKTTKYYEIIYEILGKDLPDYITYEDAKRLYDEKRFDEARENYEKVIEIDHKGNVIGDVKNR